MKYLAVALLALPALSPGAAFACPGLQVKDGWIRQAEPGAMMTAAYASLSNTGKKPITIQRASATGFLGAELHRSTIENGMHRMTEGTLELAPGQSVALEPGSWHLMLFRPPVLATGQTVAVTFQCGQKASTASFEVRAP